jgi:predicted nucleic acid-binding protein
LSTDFAAALRRRKPERRLEQLRPRDVSALTGVEDLPPGPAGLVPDTNVYINDAGGNLPPAVEALRDRTLLFHCSVCLAELAVGVANADPRHPSWAATRDHYGGLIASIPSTRLLVPDAQTWAEAGLLAGTLARTQGLQRHQRKEALNDALILLTAARAGLAVLTANRDDFDLLQQLAPEGRFVHY